MAIAALVVGICSLLAAIIGGSLGVSSMTLAIILLIVSIIGGIVGIILSAMTMKKIPEKKGFGVGGLITSIIGLIYGTISLIACVACVCAAGAVATGVADEVEKSYNNMTAEEKAQLEGEINKAIDDAQKEISNSVNQ